MASNAAINSTEKKRMRDSLQILVHSVDTNLQILNNSSHITNNCLRISLFWSQKTNDLLHTHTLQKITWLLRQSQNH